MTCPTWCNSEWWEGATEVERWRYLNRSTIRNMLGLASTSYLNRYPREKRRICQRILADIRVTRPQLSPLAANNQDGRMTVSAETELSSALSANAQRHGVSWSSALWEGCAWASANFHGARHVIVLLDVPISAALDAWLEALPEMDIHMRGHLLAEITVERVTRHDGIATVQLEALTVEER